MIAEPAHLEQMLARLKLMAIRDQLDSLLDEAAKRELTLRETLTLFCGREIARKDERRIEMAFGLAKFPFVRDLAGFDFKAQPSLDPKQIRDLASARFVANGETLLLLGPPGVGKTHLAVAIGRAAILAGYAVLFIQATTLVAALARAHGEGRLEDKLPVRHAEAPHRRRARLPAVRAPRRAPILPAGLAALRARQHADHEQPCDRRVGDGVRRSGGGDGDPRPPPPSQPRRHHPRRQLSAAREAPLRPAQAGEQAARAGADRMSPGLPRWAHRSLPPAYGARLMARGRRGPPVDYLDKPSVTPTPRGSVLRVAKGSLPDVA